MSVQMSVQEWNNVAVVAGSASGALTGLLFVAVSLNRDRIAEHPALRAEAAQTLGLFLIPLIISILLVIPGTPTWVLGTELVTFGIAAAVATLVVGRGKKALGNGTEARLARVLDVISPNLLTTLLVVVAGATLLAGGGGGLYWLVPSIILALVGGVVNAWLFLTR
jgi:hypothetical protein